MRFSSLTFLIITFSSFDNLSKSFFLKLFLFILLIISEINFLLVCFLRLDNISFLTDWSVIFLWIFSVLITSTMKYLFLCSIRTVGSVSLISKTFFINSFGKWMLFSESLFWSNSLKVNDTADPKLNLFSRKLNWQWWI